MPIMQWAKLLSARRLGKENLQRAPKIGRSEFDADADRIIFSGVFRRLSRKTQVHPLAANDHVHTRLTHSLEAAQVGRSLGEELGIRVAKELPKQVRPADLGVIVQAACLAHDLGNPPFGHGGEQAMSHWFEVQGPKLFQSLSKDYQRDIISFDGNAQGFRCITQTENHLFDGGMQLTYATLGAFLKYPWTTKVGRKKFSVFLSEREILASIASELGLITKAEGVWCRHPLAHLVEAADDICYAVLDLEDAVELRILSFEDVADALLSDFSQTRRLAVREQFASKDAFRVNLTRMRGPVFDLLVDGAIRGFVHGYKRIMSGTLETGIFELLGKEDPAKRLLARAKKLSSEHVFPDQKKVEIELGSYSTFETLLESFCHAALDRATYIRSPEKERAIGWKSNLVLKLLGNHAPTTSNAPPGGNWSQYQCLRRVIDFVSGMTDNYATYIAQQLQGMGFSGGQRP
jgi:dGTPase